MSFPDAHAYAFSLATTLMAVIVIFRAGDGTLSVMPASEYDGDFSQIVIGEWGATEILANPYAAGYYERGDVQLRILHTMDAAVRHPKAFVVADDVTL